MQRCYEHREPPAVKIPHRPPGSDYERPPRELNRPVLDHAADVAVAAGQPKPHGQPKVPKESKDSKKSQESTESTGSTDATP